MKRILPLQLLFAIAALALLSTAAVAGARCSDDPESCMKSASKSSRSTVQLASTPAPAPLAPTVTAKKATPAPVAAKKPAAKSKNGATLSPSPTPGMGVLIKLSNGNTGEISWAPTKPAEPGEKQAAQSWIL